MSVNEITSLFDEWSSAVQSGVPPFDSREVEC